MKRDFQEKRNAIYIPTRSALDWKGLLKESFHWRSGYSAKTFAHCWENANGDFPPCVKTVLETSFMLPFYDMEILFGVPEHPVPLPGGSRPTVSDLFILAKGGDGETVTMCIEAKVDEPLGPLVAQWKGDCTPPRQLRLKFLCQELGIEIDNADTLRYQLLHRTVSALIMSRKYKSKHAIMLVHSFSPSLRWFDDFQKFLGMYKISPQPNSLYHVGKHSGKELYLGWVVGESKYLHY